VAAEVGKGVHYKQSILAKAFRGELVPQDPDDVPASVLLERIEGGREKAKKLAKSKISHELDL
jgi:type I restriction enzyme S subunit